MEFADRTFVNSRPVAWARKVNPVLWLLLAYLIFIAVVTFVNGYTKHIEIYMDEWVYYGLANSLGKGMGFPAIYGVPYAEHARYVYSILLAPAFLVSSRVVQFYLIALINAAVIGCGAFPVYLLAKSVLGHKHYALLFGILYLIQPDMDFTASFMSEIAMLPAALWLLLFFYLFLLDDTKPFRKRVRYVIPFLIFSVLLYFTKTSGLVLVLICCLFIVVTGLIRIVSWIAGRGRNGEKAPAGKKMRILGLIIGILVLVGLCFLLYRYGIMGMIGRYVSAWFDRFSGELLFFLKCYLYTWITELLAVGVFPLVFPLLYYRMLSKRARRLYLFLLILLFLANFVLTMTSIGAHTEETMQMMFMLEHRYILYIWIPIFLVFAAVLREAIRIKWIPAVLTLLLVCAGCFLMKIALVGSGIEAQLLCWMVDRRNFVVAGITGVFICAGFALFRLHKRAFLIFFFAVMLLSWGYSHVTTRDRLKSCYEFSYSNIKETDAFVQAHKDKTFLLVMIPSATYAVFYNSRIEDTFLVYPNTYAVSGYEITEGIDLAAPDAMVPGLLPDSLYDLDSVDYIILSSDVKIEDPSCKIVVDNPYFSIYEPSDKTKIPPMKRRPWSEHGPFIFRPGNNYGFHSDYLKNGSFSYVSGNKPGHVVFGPYADIPAGKYKITMHYFYQGEKTGKIGHFDVIGSGLDSELLRTDVFADRTWATVEFEIFDRSRFFETRLFADVPGVEAIYLDVDYDVIYQ